MAAAAADPLQLNVEDLRCDPFAEVPGCHRPVGDRRDFLIDGVPLAQQLSDAPLWPVVHTP